MKLLYNTMIDNEVHEKYANEIIDEIEKNCKQDSSMDYMLSDIYQRMILKLGKPYMVEEEKGPKVLFFVGPTGVGKTTTKEMIYLVLSSEYNTLVGENIFVMTDDKAMKQDIRPLRVAIFNLMPTKVAKIIK